MALVVAFLVAALGAGESNASFLSTDQVLVLESWLASYPTYRLATADDDPCPTLYSCLPVACEPPEPPPDHPYQAVGDFNRDGAIDFAVVLVDTKRSESKFALVIFNGPPRK